MSGCRIGAGVGDGEGGRRRGGLEVAGEPGFSFLPGTPRTAEALAFRVLGADKDLAPARLRVGAFFASGDSPSESSLSCPSSAQLLPMESTLGARAAAAMAAGPTRVSSRVVSRVVPTSCVSCCCCDTRVALAIALGSLPSCATMSSSWYPLLIPSLGSSLASYQDIKLRCIVDVCFIIEMLIKLSIGFSVQNKLTRLAWAGKEHEPKGSCVHGLQLLRDPRLEPSAPCPAVVSTAPSTQPTTPSSVRPPPVVAVAVVVVVAPVAVVV